ncbi:MAG TPA: hypothetical protein VMV94_13880, partial [Phycisphaerae bacterium]|nr:hypothetical protein [Phycisphaerae bacterium]
QDLPPVLESSQGLAVTPTQRLYWSDHVTTTQPAKTTISKSDFSGSGETAIVSFPSAVGPGPIAVNEALNLVCWTQPLGVTGGSQILACDLNGAGSPYAIYSSVNPLAGIAVLAGPGDGAPIPIIYRVEVTAWPSSEIRRATLNGTSLGPDHSVVTIDNDVAAHLAIDATAGKLYWTQPLAGKIGRCNLDGSSPEDFLTDLGPVTGIAVWRVEAWRAAWPVVKPESMVATPLLSASAISP